VRDAVVEFLANYPLSAAFMIRMIRSSKVFQSEQDVLLP